MDSETEKLKTSIGEMQKRRVTMADGRRYLIYYTFEKRSEPSAVADGLSSVSETSGKVKNNNLQPSAAAGSSDSESENV